MTMLALVVDSIGLAVLAMVSTMNVCRNCPLLFLQQHVHDALENTGTKMSVFFHRQCNFRRSQDMVIIALLNVADLVASL